MPNPRTPVAKAKVTGAAIKNPKRHAGRSEPVGTKLGRPSEFLDKHARVAWEGFCRELPWLMESDRAMLEVCATVRGRMMAAGEPGSEPVGIQAMSMLQSCLSKLGATPADRSKVSVPDDEPEEDEFFGVN